MEIIYEEEEKLRVDVYLASCFDDYTRSYIQKMVKDGLVQVNKKVVKSNYVLSSGDEIEVTEPETIDLDIIPENIPLDIVYEDADLLVINKARGMVVHPAPGNYTGTLVNAIMFHCKDRLSSINGVARPGIVHRIDKDTSGLILVCKTDHAHHHLAAQLKAHTIHRLYEAIVYNNVVNDEGRIEGPIGRATNDRKKMTINHKNGKPAVTHYKVIERLDSNKYTYVSCKLETGRTHQIRVHMTSINNPLVGDPLYTTGKGAFANHGQMLHAKELGFIHPVTNNYIEFSAELPEDFKHILTVLQKRPH